MEFAFLRERKAQTILENAASDILLAAQKLSPVERAAALAWANAALLAGVKEYGREIAHQPMKLSRDMAVKAIIDFGNFRRQIEDAAENITSRPGHDPAVSAYKWELLACQVVIVTAGAVLSKSARTSARSIWGILKKAIPYAGDAVKLMMIYKKTYGVEAVPQVPNKIGDKEFVFKLASHLPPMFRD